MADKYLKFEHNYLIKQLKSSWGIEGLTVRCCWFHMFLSRHFLYHNKYSYNCKWQKATREEQNKMRSTVPAPVPSDTAWSSQNIYIFSTTKILYLIKKYLFDYEFGLSRSPVAHVYIFFVYFFMILSLDRTLPY